MTDTIDHLPPLVLGPLLRHVTETTAAVWVETRRPGLVSVRTPDRRGEATTFSVHGHHYAVVDVTGLAPGSAEPYEVWFGDGTSGPTPSPERVWPPAGSLFPASVLRTLNLSAPLRIVFGTCRESLAHDHVTNRRYGVDALRALALRLVHGGGPDPDGAAAQAWPALLLFLGDQVYADETSQAMCDFIAGRRDLDQPPGQELADYEEYAHLYQLAWTEPTVRWLLSTVSSAMIFDDHDIRDDWNTSHAWRQQMAATAWWQQRIVAGLGSYWVYQHLGNLSPGERADDPVWRELTAAAPSGDAGQSLDAFAARADADPGCYRWSFARDLGGSRLVVIDSRAGRVLDPSGRSMLSDAELDWLESLMTGGHDHLVLGTSLPFLLPMGLHHLESWNEAVAAGAWGARNRGWAEKVRQAADLEHWAAFQQSFQRLARSSAEVAQGSRGAAPATVLWLAGDVHHSYLAEARLPPGTPARLLQAVCSPIRNPQVRPMRWVTAALAYGLAGALGTAVARSARVPALPWRWSVCDGPWFDNSVATLDLDGRHATLSWESAEEGSTDATIRWRTLHRTRLS